MKLSEEQCDALSAAALPLRQWLIANGHPHTKIGIDQESVEVLETCVRQVFVEPEIKIECALSALPTHCILIGSNLCARESYQFMFGDGLNKTARSTIMTPAEYAVVAGILRRSEPVW